VKTTAQKVFVAIAFTALVASIGAIGVYSESKDWPTSHGVSSWRAATSLTLFAILAGNLIALIIAGSVLGYWRVFRRDPPPILGIYVTVVNVVAAFLLWILPTVL
jgi:hypothetical protein